MRKLFMSAAALLFAGALWAQEGPLWMRHCAISPDGTTIAFTYKGDIFTVPVSGGKATQITTNPAFDTTPIWSPDSKQIAFASDRMGSLDVFIVSKEGGEPRRLTTFSGSETPVAFSDAGQLLFTGVSTRSHRLPVIYGCFSLDRLHAMKNKPLSSVKTVNRYGHRTESRSTI